MAYQDNKMAIGQVVNVQDPAYYNQNQNVYGQPQQNPNMYMGPGPGPQGAPPMQNYHNYVQPLPNVYGMSEPTMIN